ncbi:indolepyruvate ferredoxin oxidoreductase [Pseudoduganella flava]|uniref:Indolepyruvate ferredoxin oxidoreductase n=1 Tax=Pseudoduganella flava TaxID=871742 RepID=A0A562PKS5_9BURK|nr:indolepyruvate ferredoxin oxidoreductase family protein [Pseudoduganella flava]QGZ42459.1 indolepyruvate ferredoxin oxidoreductase family protein [Pseudoduganella flava]TWI45029.1 indolepyruvate ferredoxin oxidoreductase [Pseudoduganella flava]
MNAINPRAQAAHEAAERTVTPSAGHGAVVDPDYQLQDNLTRTSGRVFLTGTQALVRLMLAQRQLDDANGLRTAGFVSGYRGSPLGAVDQEMWRAQDLLQAHDVEFLPAINEDLGATAVLGTQQVETDPTRKVDGVFALWYGKGPGVDRSGDALKHGNAYGSSPHGGVLVVLGDDHGCVSSSMPHQSEQALIAWSMPVLNPANIEEYLSFGLYGWALSRFSGAWVGFKAISETVEGGAVVELPPAPAFAAPDYTYPPDGLHYRWPDLPSLKIEQRVAEKLNAVRAFARANPSIDRFVTQPAEAKLGIISAGKAYLDLIEALQRMGLTRDRLEELGIRLYKPGLTWPLEPSRLDVFADGLAEVLVVEEKGDVIEQQLKTHLYNRTVRPQVLGKTDAQGQPLLSALGELRPSRIASALIRWLAPHLPQLDLAQYLPAFCAAELKAPAGTAVRTPYFCSGCPHNTSTKVPEGSVAIAGIGCHFMATWMERDTVQLTQMGGEGVTWAAASRFVARKHVFQNLGDGTYYHSGLLALRQAVAARTNITYKILYNDAVAMTGGQPVDGKLSVPQIVEQVLAEGAVRAVVVTDQPENYAQVALPTGVTVHHRAELDVVQRQLRDTAGVTVLVYDQTCAAEKRRRRKKKEMVDPPRRVVINPEVCEGCGDCGVQSNCLSIVPLETPLGRKRQIEQASCNKDYSCVEGFCPSFVSVTGGQLKKPQAATIDEAQIERALAAFPPPPASAFDKPFEMLVAGVGGTGVVTLGALVTMAAHLEGKGASTLDFMGFAQKGGAVMSHVRIARTPTALNQVRIDLQQADAVLACDAVVGAMPDALAVMRHGHTQVIANEREIPTAAFTRNPDASNDVMGLLALLRRAAGDAHVHALDAQDLATRLLGEPIAGNMLMLGYAWQRGLVPVGMAALLRAVELNGVAVAMNRKALLLGRLAAADGAVLDRLAGKPVAVVRFTPPATLEELIADRTARLAQYQDAAYAQRYVEAVRRVERRERDLDGPQSKQPLAKAVARSLYKAMAYKDEYEVARLHAATLRTQLDSQFDGDFQLAFHLAPPLLARRKPGSDVPAKIRVGGWMLPVFRLLAPGKRLRGTPFDPFGWTAERRAERAWRDECLAFVDELCARVTAEDKAVWLKLAQLPEQVRGYGHVKHAALEKVRTEAARLRAQLGAGAARAA